jgi:hypothetical protein
MAFSPNRLEVREKVEKVSAQRMRLWHALHDYIRQHGGAVVSVPGHKELRIEIARIRRSLPSSLTLATIRTIAA